MTTKTKWALTGVAIAIVAAVIASRVFQASGDAVAAGLDGEEAAAAADDFFARLKNLESSLLAKDAVPSVTRHDHALKILPTSGIPLEFKDCYDCGPEGDVEHYVIARLDDPKAVLIYRQYYEGDDEVMVTSDGTKHELPSWPVFSPDRKSFAVVASSEAFNWNGVQLWEKSGERFVKKFEYEPKGYEVFSFLEWKGADRAELQLSARDSKGREQCLPAALVRRKGAWKLEKSKTGKNAFCPNDAAWLPDFLRE